MDTHYLTSCLMLVTCLLAAACTTNPNLGEAVTDGDMQVVADMSLAPNDVVGTWNGYIPCPGCTASGVTYDLILLEDYTFEESFTYDEEENEPIYRTGTWSITDGMIQLEGKEDKRTRFSLSTAGELMMLDLEGKPVNKELQSQYSLKRNTALAEDDSRFWEDKRKIGVDFVATGHDPGWVLEIDQEKEIYFKTRPLEDVVLNTPVPAPTKTGDKTSYRVLTDSGELIVELTEQPCKDAMSGKERPYTVRVTAKGKVYAGCGMYLVADQKK